MRRSRWNWRLLICGLCTLVIAASAAGAAAPIATDSHSTSQPSTDRLVLQQADTTNNSTTQHEDPDTVNEDGDSQAVASWLRSELGSQLNNSTLQLSNGQYEQAKSMLGEDYSDSLGKLVDVTGETDSGNGGGGDSGTEETAALNQTRNTQRQFIEQTQSFQETKQAYENAKERGNDTRARRLARQIQFQATRIENLSNQVLAGYNRIENTTGVTVTQATERIQNVTSNVSETRQAIITAEFVQTRLRVAQTSPNASFTNPVTITGQLQTPNGTRTPNGTITLLAGDRTLEAPIAEDGRFTAQYQPVTAPTGRQQVRIEYIPQVDSVFLGSQTNTTLTVQAVTPTVTLNVNREQLQFSQSTTVSGRVTINESGVPGIPLQVRVGSVSIGTIETDANGRFQYTQPLPAAVPLGRQNVTATIALEDRAISTATGEQPVMVTETATTLSVDGDWRTSSVSINGQLTTRDGTPVSDQQIQLLHNGTQLTTIQTGEEGRYNAIVDPARFTSNQSQNVTAVYTPARGNLENATATIQLSPPAPSSNGNSSGGQILGISRNDGLWLVIGAVILVGASAGGVYWWRRQTPTKSRGGGNESPTPTVESNGDDSHSSSVSSDPLATALTALEEDENPGSVVRLAYSAARQALTEEVADSDGIPGTHWEFYHAYADRIAQSEDLRALTSAYERTKYGPEGATQDEAANAVTAARRILEDHTSDKE